MEGWMKISAAADYIGMSPRSVRSLLKRGLKHSRILSGTILIKPKNIDEYLEQFEVNNTETASRIETEVERIIREIETGK
jgi:hypothetical protein